MIRRICLSFLFVLLSKTTIAQINNLRHPDNYQAGEYAKLGRVDKFGKGPKDMVLIAGWGFDERLFEKLKADSIQEKYTMYAVTLPGFGGTKAYSMPEQNEVYRDLYWTKGIITALKELIESEGIEKPILLSYFTYSNILAMRLALDYPDLVDRVVIVSGMAKFMGMNPSYEPSDLEQRIYYAEKVMAQKWWKEIDRKGWNRGNFSPDIFTKDTSQAKVYWEQMSEVPIPTMVRYLLEYYSTDLSLEYQNLKIPTLVLLPAFSREVLKKPQNYYTTHIFHQSWWGAKPSNPNFHLMTITDSRAFILDDQAEKLINVINSFVDGKLNSYDLRR